MRKLSKLLFLAIPAFLLTSCNDSDDPTSSFEVAYNAASNFVHNEDLAVGKYDFESGCYMKYKFSSDNSCSIILEKLTYDGENTMNLIAPELTWTIDKATGAYSVKAASLQAIPTSGNVKSLTVTDLEVSYLNRIVGNVVFPPVIEVEMVVDGRYKVEITTSEVVSFGTTKVTTKADGSVYTTLDTYYSVLFDRTKMTASITMHNAKFADKMPAQTKIVIPGVPFTVGKDGAYKLQAAEIIPNQANGSPKPEFKITDLYCEGEFGDDSDLRFTVAGMWDVNVDLDEESLPKGFNPGL